jgi:hypothetical protein
MHLALAAVVAAAMVSTACDVSVRKDADGDKADVDIRTPVGAVSVRTGVDASGTGLPAYPGARILRDDHHDTGSADVNIGNSLFGVKVVAANFASDDAPDRIVDYYRTQMKAFGEVTECRGDIDFRGRRGARRPVCKEKWSGSRQIQLATGTEERHRLVSVKPRGGGSEFATVYIETRGRDERAGADF